MIECFLIYQMYCDIWCDLIMRSPGWGTVIFDCLTLTGGVWGLSSPEPGGRSVSGSSENPCVSKWQTSSNRLIGGWRRRCVKRSVGQTEMREITRSGVNNITQWNSLVKVLSACVCTGNRKTDRLMYSKWKINKTN